MAMTTKAAPSRVNESRKPTIMNPECVADILERELDHTIADWMVLVEKEFELTQIALNFEQRTGHLPRLLHDVIAALTKGRKLPFR